MSAAAENTAPVTSALHGAGPAAADSVPKDVLHFAEYEAEMLRLRLAGQFIADVNLAGLARTIARCGSVAPILDPTLYLHGRRRLEIVKELVTEAIRFQKAVNQFHRDMDETEDAARRSLHELEGRARALHVLTERGGA